MVFPAVRCSDAEDDARDPILEPLERFELDLFSVVLLSKPIGWHSCCTDVASHEIRCSDAEDDARDPILEPMERFEHALSISPSISVAEQITMTPKCNFYIATLVRSWQDPGEILVRSW